VKMRDATFNAKTQRRKAHLPTRENSEFGIRNAPLPPRCRIPDAGYGKLHDPPFSVRSGNVHARRVHHKWDPRVRVRARVRMKAPNRTRTRTRSNRGTGGRIEYPVSRIENQVGGREFRIPNS